MQETSAPRRKSSKVRIAGGVILGGAGLLVVLAIAITSFSPRHRIIHPEKIPAEIGSLPEYASFTLSGLDFYGDNLYLTGSLGVLEIAKDRVVALHQWNAHDRPVSGPWPDLPGDALWFQEAAGGKLLRLDADGWHEVPMPRPRNTRFTRGDVLVGFRGITQGTDFWLTGARFVWHRNGKPDSWIAREIPPETYRL